MSVKVGIGIKVNDIVDKLVEPLPDIAICSVCGWRGLVINCPTEEEGDWENGYHTVEMCPECDDGGCIDDYDMTPRRAKAWEEWYKEHTMPEIKGLKIVRVSDLEELRKNVRVSDLEELRKNVRELHELIASNNRRIHELEKK